MRTTPTTFILNDRTIYAFNYKKFARPLQTLFSDLIGTPIKLSKAREILAWGHEQTTYNALVASCNFWGGALFVNPESDYGGEDFVEALLEHKAFLDPEFEALHRAIVEHRDAVVTALDEMFLTDAAFVPEDFSTVISYPSISVASDGTLIEGEMRNFSVLDDEDVFRSYTLPTSFSLELASTLVGLLGEDYTVANVPEDTRRALFLEFVSQWDDYDDFLDFAELELPVGGEWHEASLSQKDFETFVLYVAPCCWQKMYFDEILTNPSLYYRHHLAPRTPTGTIHHMKIIKALNSASLEALRQKIVEELKTFRDSLNIEGLIAEIEYTKKRIEIEYIKKNSHIH